MNEYHLYDCGSGSMATEYPKSDNNGSASDASTIPKDGDHLKEGPEEVAELNQIENTKYKACQSSHGGKRVLRNRTRVKNSGRWTPGVRAHASSANGDLQRGRMRYFQCSDNFGLIWDICGRHGGYRCDGD